MPARLRRPVLHRTPRQTPRLVAVVSCGPGCPHSGDDLGARTDNLSGWINDTIGGPDAGLLDRRPRSADVVVLVAALLAASLAALALRPLRPRGSRRPGGGALPC